MSTNSKEALIDVFVVPLERLGRDDLALAGGKGTNLGELVRLGFPVPDGFVVTTAAYDGFVAHNRLGETITRALREPQDNGATIRAAFERAPIPPEIERNILAAYREHGEGPVAVRSSATAEDLPEAAFAGQQDTFLNISDEQALLDSVRRCWASLWTDRAIAYRERQRIDQRTVKLAIVVQRMVFAEIAGVLFTANPVTGARDEVVIDASPGLGEAVVSGLVTPDHFVLRKRRWGWSIAERRAGLREVIVRARLGGATEHMDGSADIDVPVLPDRALRRLARLGVAIERHFERPQDVEWAWASGELFILQARPITVLPEPTPRPSKQQQRMAGMVAEMLPVRPYPLEVTTWGFPLLHSAMLGPVFAVVGLRFPSFQQLFDEEDGVVVRFRGGELPRPTPGILLAPMRLLWLAWRYDIAHWHADPLLAEAQSRAHALEARDLRALSWESLLATVRETLTIPFLIGELRRRYLPRAALAVGGLRLALALLGHADRFSTLLFSGVETKVLEANRALEEMAARVRFDPALAKAFANHEASELWAALEEQPSGEAFLAELRSFLDRYGHREAGGTLLVSQSTWKDRPEAVLGILKGLALAEPRPQTQHSAWEVARDDVLAHPLLRLPPLRSAFLKLLAEARWFQQLREDTRFYFMLLLPVLRRTLLELGRRLDSVEVLDAPEDVFHLKLAELERIDGTWPPPPQLADQLRALMARRKKRRAELKGTPLVDPRLFHQEEIEGDVLLSGTPGSPGVAEGPVRIIRDGSEFGKLRSGEVLVAPYTNPAWTPLFQRAAAVVVDSGGAASHAAIVAREYRIPAVMGTPKATQKLTDGQRVRVDGNHGRVTLLIEDDA
jgi:pyruvate,water dikinase